MTPTTLDHVLVALLAALAGFAVFRGQPQMKTLEFDAAMRRSVYWTNAIVLWAAAAVTVLVWTLGDRPLEDLGLRWRHERPTVGLALAGGLVALVAALLAHDFATPARRARSMGRLRTHAPFLPRTRRDLGHFCVLALAAGTAEEVIARGFLIRYIDGVATRLLPESVAPGLVTTIAVLLPALAFTVAHRYQPVSMLVRVFALAATFGAIFVATGSLLIPMVLHTAVDVVAGALVVRADGGAGASPDSGSGAGADTVESPVAKAPADAA